MSITLTITEQIGRGDALEKILCAIELPVGSRKRLTGKRAAKTLARACPQIVLGVIKTKRGWWASRAITRTEKCSFHYVWRNYYLAERN